MPLLQTAQGSARKEANAGLVRDLDGGESRRGGAAFDHFLSTYETNTRKTSRSRALTSYSGDAPVLVAPVLMPVAQMASRVRLSRPTNSVVVAKISDLKLRTLSVAPTPKLLPAIVRIVGFGPATLAASPISRAKYCADDLRASWGNGVGNRDNPVVWSSRSRAAAAASACARLSAKAVRRLRCGHGMGLLPLQIGA